MANSWHPPWALPHQPFLQGTRPLDLPALTKPPARPARRSRPGGGQGPSRPSPPAQGKSSHGSLPAGWPLGVQGPGASWQPGHLPRVSPAVHRASAGCSHGATSCPCPARSQGDEGHMQRSVPLIPQTARLITRNSELATGGRNSWLRAL